MSSTCPTVRISGATFQANLIRLLNPALRGWANYHSHVVAKETFVRVDADVWSMLWRWAVRKHPSKGAHCVKGKYFKTRRARNWVFTATEKQEDGTQRELTPLQESDTPIQRHVKIRANANPHDPEWEHYFESRRRTKMQNSLKGRAKLYRVWLSQDGLCPDCQEPITTGIPWGVRCIVKRTEGGSNAASNLQVHQFDCRINH
ncbi:group II intron maturase-specific domain-containing protein [Trinickia mobilis]|uniref:group II intron maturase-specific domain-containing protein n=1 Tax=Trinickia mobilis TaxID=2816356 RepID=UPI001A8ECE15